MEQTDNHTPVDDLFVRPRKIAPWWHLVGYLLIIATLFTWGFHQQHFGIGPGIASHPHELGMHRDAIRFYLTSIIGDILLLAYCWWGVKAQGGKLAMLTGGRWHTWKSVLKDFSIALPFWLIWEGAAYGTWMLLGPPHARSVLALLPHSPLEVMVWIVVSMVAGFCEEIQNRGYLQQQLYALSSSLTVAVLLQALIFGAEHSYQGIKHMTVVAVLGVLYGLLAVRRRNLRANMIAHAWSDVWEGWLKLVIWH